MEEVKAEMKPMRMANDAELKDVVKAIGDSAMLISDAVHGFKFSEISEFVGVIGDIRLLLKDGPVLFPEFKALDEAARADLVAYVVANVKFPASQPVEDFLDKALLVAISVSALFALLVKPSA